MAVRNGNKKKLQELQENYPVYSEEGNIVDKSNWTNEEFFNEAKGVVSEKIVNSTLECVEKAYSGDKFDPNSPNDVERLGRTLIRNANKMMDLKELNYEELADLCDDHGIDVICFADVDYGPDNLITLLTFAAGYEPDEVDSIIDAALADFKGYQEEIQEEDRMFAKMQDEEMER